MTDAVRARTVYYCAATLDGYIADTDDRIDWLMGYEGSFEGDRLESHPLAEGGSYDRFYEGVGARDIWIVGGGNVASQFADAGLLDELHVTIVPVVLGAGKPLFDRAMPGAPLQLLGIRPYANGMVELRYARR